MDRSEVISLISVSYSKDKNGISISTESKRDVFVSVSSASGDEWFKGNQIGIRAMYRFTMFAYDYENEEECEYKGERYIIYRTYIGKNDSIELYVKKVSGN